MARILCSIFIGRLFSYEMTKQLRMIGKAIKMTGVTDTYAQRGENFRDTAYVLKKSDTLVL
jgi:hypothetical protein